MICPEALPPTFGAYAVAGQEGLKMKRSGMSSPTCCNLSHSQTFMIKINLSFWNYPALTDSSCCGPVPSAASVNLLSVPFLGCFWLFRWNTPVDRTRLHTFHNWHPFAFARRRHGPQRRCNCSSGFREVHLKHIQANQFHFFAQT